MKTDVCVLKTHELKLKTGVCVLKTHELELKTHVCLLKTLELKLKMHVCILKTHELKLKTHVYVLKTHELDLKTGIFILNSYELELKTGVLGLEMHHRVLKTERDILTKAIPKHVRQDTREQKRVHLDKPKNINVMPIVKVIEVIASSSKGIDDAIQQAVAEASKTVRNIDSVYVKDIKAHVKDGKITTYGCVCKISFRLD